MPEFLNPQQYGRVAVVYGGQSAEREISLMSGAAVLLALQNSGVDVIGIDADRNLLNTLRAEKISRVFIMLHGRDGEDGKLQGALEWMGIPYTGSGVLASSLAMDKAKCKLMWLQLGLTTPQFVKLEAEANPRAILDALGPVFIKPVNEGSSIGIAGAKEVEAFMAAWQEAARFDHEVLAEQWIVGREFTVTILAGAVLPVIELRSPNAFYDYQAKYFSDDTRYLCPCDLDAAATARIQQLALAAYQTLDCRGWGRVDVMQDQSGKFWLLEVNTAPGMTSHSLVPMAAAAAGIGFDELVMRILHTSLGNEAMHHD